MDKGNIKALRTINRKLTQVQTLLLKIKRNEEEELRGKRDYDTSAYENMSLVGKAFEAVAWAKSCLEQVKKRVAINELSMAAATNLAKKEPTN